MYNILRLRYGTTQPIRGVDKALFSMSCISKYIKSNISKCISLESKYFRDSKLNESKNTKKLLPSHIIDDIIDRRTLCRQANMSLDQRLEVIKAKY